MNGRKLNSDRIRSRKGVLEFVSAVCIPILYLGFVVTEHYGFWTEVRGMNAVKKVAAQMNTSYDPDVRRQFRPGDEGWDPTVWLIKKYSKAQIPKDKKPVLIARHVAVLSGKADLDGGKFAEWTAPSTPIYLIYSELPTKDAVHVGTIGDLFVWIEKSENDFRFYVQTLILGVFSLILGVLIWRQQTLASGSLQDYGGKKEPPNMESHRSCDPSVNRGSGSPISTITPLRS